MSKDAVIGHRCKVIVMHRQALRRIHDDIASQAKEHARLGIFKARPRNRHVVGTTLHIDFDQRVFFEHTMVHPNMVRTVMNGKGPAGRGILHRNRRSRESQIFKNQVARNIGEHSHARNADVAAATVERLVRFKAKRGLQIIDTVLLEKNPSRSFLVSAFA